MDKVLIAQWESPNGKRFLRLFRDQWGYSYRGDDCGGSWHRGQCPDDAAAIEKATVGRFSPLAMLLTVAKRARQIEVPHA